MKRLDLYFDARCALCITIVRWLASQQQLVPIRCIPKQEGVDDLVVVADTGHYWRGDAAWLIVLWALDEYRDWSMRLSRPALLPLARQAFTMLSSNRHLLANWLNLAADEELATRLRNVTVSC